MYSVTQRIRNIKQPRGGYINISDFDIKTFDDGNILCEEENVHSSIVGLVVDYMTRYLMGTEIKEAFQISILGAEKAEKLGEKGSVKAINNYLNNIDGIDDVSIKNACRAVTYDVWFRNVLGAFNVKKGEDTNPDSNTINNIRILINRSVEFFKNYGPIVLDGFTFEGGGYTSTIVSGDGDFLTKDTLWDFKVSKSKPKPEHTLQILVYYIMGKHSGKPEFNSIKKIGIFNPRLNTVYTKNLSEISDSIIKQVEEDVICYNDENSNRVTDEMLDIIGIMELTGMPRYKIMNLYTYYKMPLKKEKNKYVISKSEFITWYEEYKAKTKQAVIIYIVIMIIGLIITLIYLASV